MGTSNPASLNGQERDQLYNPLYKPIVIYIIGFKTDFTC